MKTHKYICCVGALLLAGCEKTATHQNIPHTPWNNPSAIGLHSVFINEPDGRALIYNPDNGATEMEPTRDAALAKLPHDLNMYREINPHDPQ